MPIRALDSGWPAQTPQETINDAVSLGASLLLLYDADFSIPGANKSAAFLDAVDQGVPVIPICTPSNVPPDTAQQVLGIMVAQNLSHKFCAFDLETYSFPPVAWVTACVDLLHAAGWKVIGYGFQSTKAIYGACGFDYWWGVIGYSEGYGYLPSWCDMFQYTDVAKGPSGATYDASTVSDSLWAAFTADPGPGPQEDDDVRVIFAYGGGEFVSDGITFRWISNQWDLNWLNSCFTIKNLGNVNGLAGAGVPADPTTASLLNLPWPAKGPA